jgi:tRNA(Ile2)-agmatinylcytidine synthase
MKRYQIIGFPRLVRLNPNIPWKTRGNGALCLQVGKPTRTNTQKIGEVDEHEIKSSPEFTEELDASEQRALGKIVKETVDAQAWIDDENTNPGYVLLVQKPGPELYWKAVRSIASLDEVHALLHHHEAMFEGYKNSRGLIGATAAICWEPLDKTFELIAYRHLKRWGSKRNVDARSVQTMDSQCPSTFDNYDEVNHHNRIVPNSPCPILYGIRGDDINDLMRASALVKSEPIESWLLFETNQGTDDHLQQKSLQSIQPFESVITKGTVCGSPFTIRGGHVLFFLHDQTGTIPCAAYEPTKEFRHRIRGLREGDLIEVYGGVREHPLTINLEKICIKQLTSVQRKVENPVCPRCGKHMKSKGTKQGYKCIRCGTKSNEPMIQDQQRTLSCGFYEVPVCARRHLSKPLKRIGTHQAAMMILLDSKKEIILRNSA